MVHILTYEPSKSNYVYIQELRETTWKQLNQFLLGENGFKKPEITTVLAEQMVATGYLCNDSAEPPRKKAFARLQTKGNWECQE